MLISQFKSCSYLALFYLSISFCSAQQDFSLKKKSQLYEIPELDHVTGITSAIKDKHGFIWLAGQNGLFRFDGYETKQYAYDPTKPDKIAGNWIADLMEDEYGNIWFNVFGIGLQKLDPVTETFTLFTADPNAPDKIPNNRFYLSPDYNDNIWINTQGLEAGKYSPNTNTFKRYNNITGWTDFINSNNSVWALSTLNGSGGIFKYDEILDSFLLKMALKEDCIALLADKEKIYCNLNGVFSTYDIKNNKITRNDKLKKDVPLSAIFVQNGKIIIIRNTVIEEFDPLSQTFKLISNEKRIEDLILGGYQTPVIPINQNQFFIASNKNFILEYNQNAIEKFELLLNGEKFYFKRGMLAPNSNTGFRVGHSIICDLEKEEISHPYTTYTSLKKIASVSDNFFESYTNEYVDKEGIHWIVLFERTEPWSISFYKFNPKDAKLILLKKIDASQNTGTIWGVAKEGETIWLATWRSLVKFDINSKEYTIIGEKKDSTGLCSGGLRCVFLDKSGDLWVGTQGGLNRKKKGTDYFIHYLSINGDTNSLSFNSVSNIHEDKNGLIWIGTMGGGLNSFDKKTNRFKWFTTHNGLPDNNIWSVEIQKDQTIWFSHNKGISHLNSVTGKIQNYSNNKLDGVVESYENLSTTLDDGSMIFAGYGEFNHIRPHLLVTDSAKTPLYVTEIKLFNKSLGINNSDSILHQTISFTKSLTFNHNQNDITLKYAAMDYTEKEHRQYAYMLEGFDKDWQYVDKKREVTFTNLSSGTYTFRVKSSNRYDIWYEMEQPLIITILPPWWQSWWAYTLYLALILFAGWKLHSYQKAITIKKERENARERELEQAKQIKTAYRELGKAHENLKSTQAQLIQSEKMASLGELTAGIAHEIQNPLNFVNNFSELSIDLSKELKEEVEKTEIDKALIIDLATDLSQNQEKINYHGKRASDIVKGMLEHSRKSSGIKEPIDINALCDEYLRLAYHGLRAKDKSFNATMETNLDPTLPKIEVVSQDIGRVLLNLINNAFYAINERANLLNVEKQSDDSNLKDLIYKPTVSITTQLTADSQLQISIKDNGSGIPAHIKDKIFQPFFTTKPTGQGTGLGLSLAYDIIKAHEGELKVETVDGEGSTFIIQLPFVNMLD